MDELPTDVIVSHTRRGRGFVIVRGLERLRAELERNGVAYATLQSSGRQLVLYRTLEGELRALKAEDRH